MEIPGGDEIGDFLEQVGFEKHPMLFRTRAACWAYRQRHWISPGEANVW